MKKIANPVIAIGLTAALLSACGQSASNLALLTEDEQKNSAISVYVPPAFPEAAAKSCHAGSVLVEYDVAYSGKVKDDSVRVLADAGSPALADAAVSAVKRWSYAPAYKDGALLERRNLRTAVNFEIEGCEPINS
ncbi:MAG: energy transducer TonB [Pseudomonadota bacterium]